MEGADAVLKRAHLSGYRFPQGFAGFAATIDTSAGDHGSVIVDADRIIQLTIDGTPSGDADWVRAELGSIVSHRWPSRYEDGDGRFAKRVEGDTVLMDDPLSSAYRVGPHGIREVHRTAGATRFVISVSQRHHLSDGRHLPAHFTVFHWSVESGRLQRTEHFYDTYVAVDGIQLPHRREVTSATDEGLTSRMLELSNHVLTQAVETKDATHV